MRAAKVQASLRIRAVSPEPSLLAHTSSESRGTFRQKARSLAPLNGWACAVKICHDGMLEDTNSLDGVKRKMQDNVKHKIRCLFVCRRYSNCIFKCQFELGMLQTGWKSNAQQPKQTIEVIYKHRFKAERTVTEVSIAGTNFHAVAYSASVTFNRQIVFSFDRNTGRLLTSDNAS